MTGNVPSRSGVILSEFTDPGTASSFWPNSGTQNECVTSLEVILSSTARSIGSCSVGDFRPLYCGYAKLHANCCAVTSTVRWFFGRSSFFASATALTIEIEVTSAAGTAVQTISSPVCPWIGGPSESSSGRTRNLMTE
jgi:hypothetical protein